MGFRKIWEVKELSLLLKVCKREQKSHGGLAWGTGVRPGFELCHCCMLGKLCKEAPFLIHTMGLIPTSRGCEKLKYLRLRGGFVFKDANVCRLRSYIKRGGKGEGLYR